MKAFALGLCLVGAAHANTVAAQTLSHSGTATDNVSALFVVQSTRPVIYGCSGSRATCFRMLFDIRPSGNAAIRVGVPAEFNRSLHYTQAFAGSGVLCKAKTLGGQAIAVPRLGGSYRWASDAVSFLASRTKPSNLLTEFRCDGQLVQGDELRIQMAFAVDRGRGIEIARFVFSNVKLQTRR